MQSILMLLILFLLSISCLIPGVLSTGPRAGCFSVPPQVDPTHHAERARAHPGAHLCPRHWDGNSCLPSVSLSLNLMVTLAKKKKGGEGEGGEEKNIIIREPESPLLVN